MDIRSLVRAGAVKAYSSEVWPELAWVVLAESNQRFDLEMGTVVTFGILAGLSLGRIQPSLQWLWVEPDYEV
jgi:hypothetical protein